MLLAAGSLYAQVAGLRGQVTDESGALVPSAKVTVTSDSGVVTATTSGTDGGYAFPMLAPGNYTVQATAPSLGLPQPMKVTVGSAAMTLNLRLLVATTTQQVTIRDNAGPAITTDASTNASAIVLTGDSLDALADDPDDLQADLQALAGPGAGPGGASIFVDGFSGGQLPAKSSIREIRLNQNPFAPEYDRLGIGRIEIFTKPGSDSWHGQMNYNIDTDRWNTRDPYSAQKAPLLLNEFEGGVGGPLNHRTSFTLDAQREKVDNGSIVNGITVDPATLADVPLKDILTTPQLRIMVSPRIDYQLSANNTLTARYSFNELDIHNAGIGSFDQTSRGYHSRNIGNTVQLTETAVLGTAVNETRFQFVRSVNDAIANSLSPAIQVLGAFNGGGSQTGISSTKQNSFELQNYTSMIRGTHSLKFGVRLREQTLDSLSPRNFGGTFTFGGGTAPVLGANNQPVLDGSGQIVTAPIQGIDRYRRYLLFQKLGLSPAQAQLLGGAPTQFTITAGTPDLSVDQSDVSVFVGDDWRARPNLTISAGVRYEAQTNTHDHRDWAPRVALAWGVGSGKARPKTVIRTGFGMFYDRFGLGNTLTADRFGGTGSTGAQQQYVVTNPVFYPNIPSIASLAGSLTTQVTQEISSQLRSPYILQSVLSVERQLPANTTLAVTYSNSHGLHQLRSEDINAPLPGSVYPLGGSNPVFLMTSSGLYNQNQLIFNVNSKVSKDVTLTGSYVLNRARSNTDGLGTFPANPYNFSGEYGPASTDVHNRVSVTGSINLKWHVRVSPNIAVQSGAPFDITAGSDLYGTTLFNGRPGFATDPNRPGLVQTAYGLLDPNPTATEKLVPRNYGRGPGQVMVNVRIGKTWGFGHERGKSAPAPTLTTQAPVMGGVGVPQQNNGGGIAAAVANTVHPFNATISASFRNLINHNNPGAITGNITSPLFGEANQSAGSGGGGGISEAGNNRRLEMQFRVTF